jgi:hypothetical protein
MDSALIIQHPSQDAAAASFGCSSTAAVLLLLPCWLLLAAVAAAAFHSCCSPKPLSAALRMVWLMGLERRQLRSLAFNRLLPLPLPLLLLLLLCSWCRCIAHMLQPATR